MNCRNLNCIVSYFFCFTHNNNNLSKLHRGHKLQLSSPLAQIWVSETLTQDVQQFVVVWNRKNKLLEPKKVDYSDKMNLLNLYHPFKSLLHMTKYVTDSGSSCKMIYPWNSSRRLFRCLGRDSIHESSVSAAAGGAAEQRRSGRRPHWSVIRGQHVHSCWYVPVWLWGTVTTGKQLGFICLVKVLILFHDIYVFNGSKYWRRGLNLLRLE